MTTTTTEREALIANARELVSHKTLLSGHAPYHVKLLARLADALADALRDSQRLDWMEKALKAIDHDGIHLVTSKWMGPGRMDVLIRLDDLPGDGDEDLEVADPSIRSAIDAAISMQQDTHGGDTT